MKKLFISVLISIIIIFLVDISWFFVDVYNVKAFLKKRNIPENRKFKYFLRPSFNQSIEKILYVKFREPINIKSNLAPIYLFGCSFAYGDYLNDNETFGAYLAKITNRPVYNFGFHGWGIQHVLLLLEHYDFSKIKTPKYIIYIYMDDHIRRMYSKYFEGFDDASYFRYLYKNGEFIPDESNGLTLYLYRKIHCYKNYKTATNPKNNEKNFNLFKKYIEKINDLIKEKFPDSKFIIFVYEEVWNKQDWQSVEKMGIKVVRKEEDLGNEIEEYRLGDSHPSAKAWEHYTPIFIKKSGIK